MILRIIMTTMLATAFAVLQSILLTDVMPLGVVPDIALIVIVAAAWRYGPIIGPIAGFLVGLALDAMSLSPLGFHAFLYTLIAYLFGRLNGSIAPGPVVLPGIAALAATGVKYAGSYLLALVFGLNSGALRYFTVSTLIETAENLVLAPVIFWLFGLAVRATEGRRGGFH